MKIKGWTKIQDSKTGTGWHHDDFKTSVFVMIEKDKGKYIWKVKTIKGKRGKLRTLKNFSTRQKATVFAGKWMRRKLKTEARKEKVKAGLKKTGKKISKAYKEYQSPAAKKKRAKARKAREKKMSAAQKQWSIGGKTSGPRWF